MGATGNQWLFLMLISPWTMGFCAGQGSSVVSSFSRPETWLRPYDWTYLRVEVPPWFSSVVITFVSNVAMDKDHVKQLPKSSLPVVCLNYGNPPLPDVSDSSLGDIFSHSILNYTFGGLTNLHDVEQCVPFEKNLTVTLTNEQMSPGVWYLGFFNGLGPARTQSKMISRGRAYVFRTSISIEACAISTAWGPYCNQPINTISCSQSSANVRPRSLLDVKEKDKGSVSLNHPVESGEHMESNYHMISNVDHTEQIQGVSNSSVLSTEENLISCKNSYESCLGFGDQRLYFLDILGVASQFKISATNLRFNQTSSVNNSTDGISLMCYARYDAMPLISSHDYSADISRYSLIVKSPKIGRWFISVQSVNQTTVDKVMQENTTESSTCFSFEWDVLECLNRKAGVNCTWEMHMLQRVLRRSANFPLDSYFTPNNENESFENADFSLEYLLSNTSVDNATWTYFFLDVPRGAAGATMHIQLVSDITMDSEIYLRYGGIASIDTWDYYLNSTGSSNGSMFWVFNDSDKKGTNLYILYPMEGTWCLGMKHTLDLYKYKTTMSISLVGCPRHCSSHGDCRYSVDESGSTFYSYCSCDRDHGGFDCSDELVSRKGHISQSIFLIASNAAALLPAFWALRQKAFSEWVLFTSSGISSALYHACDVGTWCPLSFHVLQFMDFWLSFMAVVSTFVYMTTIGEASKRAIHTCVAILTALLAVNSATRSTNIVLVIAIGTVGLLIGWLLEFSTTNGFRYCPEGFDLNVDERWQNIQRWFWNLLITLQKRFRWHFVVLGFIFLAFAGTSWKLESNATYWIWHSLWHISIYTSSFFFLCSTSATANNVHEEPEYELTRQNSSSRTE